MSVVNKAKIDVIDRDTQVQAGIIDECLNLCKKINSRTDKVMDRLKNQLMYGQAYGPLKKSRESKSLLEKSLLGGIFKGILAEGLTIIGAMAYNITTIGTVVGKTPSAIINKKLSPNFPIGDDYLPTVKYDGTCVLYFNGKWYCKRNITKKTASKWITSPEDLSGCVFFPDETNLMRVYWAPITPKDKWHNQAIHRNKIQYNTINQNGEASISTINPDKLLHGFELVGPKVQSSHYPLDTFQEGTHFLLPHGTDVLTSWNYDEFIKNPYHYSKQYIEDLNIEGVVLYTSAGLFKINRNSIESNNHDKFLFFVPELNNSNR